MEPINNSLPPEYLPDPFQQAVTLKDGTILNGSGAFNDITGDLFIWPEEIMSFVDATMMFSNADKTGHIRIDYSKIEYNEYDGYTRLYGITSNPAGKLTIRLRKEVD